MSGVKRFEAHYLTEGVMGGKALACAEMVLASDYDKLECLVEAGHKLSMDAACGEIAALEAERDTFKAECVNLNNILDQIRAERDALRAQIEVMRADSDLYRQWFNAVQDLNPHYLEQKDYQAAARLLERLGMRVPLSVVAGAAVQTKP